MQRPTNNIKKQYVLKVLSRKTIKDWQYKYRKYEVYDTYVYSNGLEDFNPVFMTDDKHELYIWLDLNNLRIHKEIYKYVHNMNFRPMSPPYWFRTTFLLKDKTNE